MMPRLYLELIAAAVLCAGFAFFVHHERQIGVAQCQADTKTALDAQVAQQKLDHDQQTTTVLTIGDTFHETTSAPLSVPAPVVRVCNNQVRRSTMPQASTTTASDHEEANSGAANTVDIGTPLVIVGRDADAQVTALQSYITEVCLK
jgi:hypothetical protein